mgnify:CR=1 FL=1
MDARRLWENYKDSIHPVWHLHLNFFISTHKSLTEKSCIQAFQALNEVNNSVTVQFISMLKRTAKTCLNIIFSGIKSGAHVYSSIFLLDTSFQDILL